MAGSVALSSLIGPGRRAAPRAAAACALALAMCALLATSARAAPTTITFESGATPGQPVTNQYGPPGTPAGPTFMKASDAGFSSGPGCRPPTLDNTDPAHSGASSLKLDGCTGAEFWSTATFFALGYSTDSVDFWVAGGSASSHVVTTALDTSGNIVDQTVTTLAGGSSYVHAQVTSTSDNIAYVAIEYGELSPYGSALTHVAETSSTAFLYVDDLTYDPPSSPPASSFRLGASPTNVAAAVGGKAQVTIPITWTNNPNPSASPVSLEVSGLPPDVTPSFSPNPTSTGSSVLTLSVASNAPLFSTYITVTGYVDKGLPSQKQASVQFGFDEYPAFTIANPPAVTLAPCTPRQVKLEVNTQSSFNQPVTVSVSTAFQSGVLITGISGGEVLDPHHASASVTPSGDVAAVTVDLAVPAGTAPAGPQDLAVFADASGYATQSNYAGKLTIEAGEVDNVIQTGTLFTPTLVSAPALGAPGTGVTLRGAGFCPGTSVAIGDANNVASAFSISADGTSLMFTVPPGATDGPIHVIPPTGANFDGPPLSVRTFRDTYGFSWANGSYGSVFTTDMETELFGFEETHFRVPPFFIPIPKPEAGEFWVITNKNIPNGLCFGIAYSSLQFFDFPDNTSGFPSTGGSTPWDLNGPTAPSSSLLRFVTERFSLQFTDQLIPVALNQIIGTHSPGDDLNAIKSELAAGHPAMVGLIKWNGTSPEGHTVLAYDTHPLLGGATAIDVVNSNVPYDPKEATNASLHDSSEFTNSEIIYNPDGTWSFPEGQYIQGSGGQPWTGSEADMVVYPHSKLPILNGQDPKLPNVFTAFLIAMGSSKDSVTQLSGSGGALFRGGQLAPQSSWPKGLAPLPNFSGVPGPLQLIALDPRRATPLSATIERHRGGGAMSMYLDGLQATLQGGARDGQLDHVSVNPRTDTIGYQSGAPSPLSGSLLAAGGAHATAGGSASELADHTVQFATTTSRNGRDTLAFPSGRELVLTHTGAPANLSLTLSAFTSSGLPIAVSLPPIRLAAGETLRAAPTRWSGLGSAVVRLLSTVHGRTTVRLVRGRLIGRRFASAPRARLTSTGIAVSLHIRGLPSQASVSIAASVMRGRRLVQRAVPVALSGGSLRSGVIHLALSRRLARGRYSVLIRLLEITPKGTAQGSVLVTRRIRTVAR